MSIKYETVIRPTIRLTFTEIFGLRRLYAILMSVVKISEQSITVAVLEERVALNEFLKVRLFRHPDHFYSLYPSMQKKPTR